MGKASKRRQKNTTKKTPKVAYVERPFEGLTGESDLVAMREILPAASARVRTTQEYGDREVLLVTLLPDLIPGAVRSDGTPMVAMQSLTRSGDASRDVAATLLDTLELEDGASLGPRPLPAPGPRLQDVLSPADSFDVEVFDSFAYILSDDEADDPQLAEAVESSKQSITPSAAVPGVASAYWCLMSKPFVRWIRPEDPERVIDGIARLHAERASSLTEEARFLGAFRACGISVPVWELTAGTQADDLAEPMAEFDQRFTAAIEKDEALSADERRARAGIVSRQVELR